jgi:nucleoside-diphosphate-sugar epimerase
LIVGCGDVGLRVARQLAGRWRLLALTSSPGRRETLRTAGAQPLDGDLDRPETLGRLAGLADAVLHLAPPPGHGQHDPRTSHLLAALARCDRVRRLVYGSTTGVYGDAGGARIDETHRLAPQTERARRRVDAEARVRAWGRARGVAVTILRIPGIYALDREGGTPAERLRRGTPVLRPEDDVYTNHVHADDLARACAAALARGPTQRAINVCDDTEMRMGEYFEFAADLMGLPQPPRISRAEAAQQLSPALLSFMSESRRISNARLKRELRFVAWYPTVREGLAAAACSDVRSARAPAVPGRCSMSVSSGS